MRICYFGTYREEYSRNQIMIEGLRQAGVEVIECHEPLWQGIEDRVKAASGGWFRFNFAVRVIGVYWRLLQRYRSVGPYDIMVVGYPGQMDVFLARLLTWARKKPLVWDIFMSIYLIALERGLEKRSRLTVFGLRSMEWLATRLPNLLIMDTEEYVRWFAQTYGIAAGRFRLVPTGADDRIFQPKAPPPADDGLFHILYYGTFIPNHGTRYMVEAAHLLETDPTLQFEFIGEGPELELAQTIAGDYCLKNVLFSKWMEKPFLMERIARADLILGAFGTTPQSVMTIQNKIYEGLAMARPVVTGDSPALRQSLQHGEHIYLCDRQNSSSLAEAIRTMKNDAVLRNHIAAQGNRIFNENYCLRKNGERFAAILRSVINN